MKFTRSGKATALLLLVSLQYSFAALDAAICSGAVCYPKVAGGKVSQPVKRCPDGFSLEKDGSGKDVCVKRAAKACAAGQTLQDGRCCGKKVSSTCISQPAGGCPAGYKAKRDCAGASFDLSFNKTGRHLLSGGNPVVKELNILGQAIVPNVILPKPALSVNIAPSTKKPDTPKINITGGHTFPQIILPQPKVSFTMPPMPKAGPQIKFEGHPSIIPKIIPVLPEPLVTVEVPKGPAVAPKVTTDIATKKVTVDLSQLGPKHTVDLNLPALPDIWHQATKIPDIQVNLPDNMPKVIDLSGLGPKKVYNITLPQVKLPKQGSLTIVNSGANEPQFLDLTHLGPKHRTGINVKLPNVETKGATVNVVVEDDKAINGTIVIPGHKLKHNTVINVPGPQKEWPEKKSSLVVDIAANPKVTEMLAGLQKPKGQVEKVDIQLPDIDLSKHMPAGKDVVIEVKPLLKFNHTLKEKPAVSNIDKRINIEMKNITIPRVINDTTIVIKPLEVSKVAKHLLPHGLYNKIMAESAAGNSTVITTNTVINMPNKTLPSIPVPKDKIDAAVSIPIKMGLHQNGSQPDGLINIAYKEEWTGGNPVLPHPGAKVAKAAEQVINAVSGKHCPAQCCAEVEEEVCDDSTADVQTVEPTIGCEAGFTLDAASGACTNGEVKVEACPAGMSRCSVDGKGVCVPAVDGKIGHELCKAFKAVCLKASIVAKSCAA